MSTEYNMVQEQQSKQQNEGWITLGQYFMTKDNKVIGQQFGTLS